MTTILQVGKGWLLLKQSKSITKQIAMGIYRRFLTQRNSYSRSQKLSTSSTKVISDVTDSYSYGKEF